jgi:hypothetical protein
MAPASAKKVEFLEDRHLKRTEGDAMPRAILKNGVIYPVDPLPSDWKDGQELWVDATESLNGAGLDKEEGKNGISTNTEADAAFEDLEHLCADSDPVAEEKMLAAIEDHRRQAKALMRRRMGLPE